MADDVQTSQDWHTYHRVSRSGTYSFLAALPLILIYEILIVFTNGRAVSQVRVGAEVWLKQSLALVGSAGLAAFGAIVILVGIGIFYFERRRRIPLLPRYFAWMILESAVYAVLVAIIVSGLVGAVLTLTLQDGLLSHAAAMAPFGKLQQAVSSSLRLQVALSVGAGVYEELVFRVLLVGGLYLLFRKLLTRRGHAYLAAALLGALIFSYVHYLGPLGDAFTIGSFLFRFFFGLVLNILFLLRGFGIAAWTHALYDIMLVLGIFG
ncbi:MAG: CPBP family glutamic-type intramembrane protease [Rhodothermales bacterium]